MTCSITMSHYFGLQTWDSFEQSNSRSVQNWQMTKGKGNVYHNAVASSRPGPLQLHIALELLSVQYLRCYFVRHRLSWRRHCACRRHLHLVFSRQDVVFGVSMLDHGQKQVRFSSLPVPLQKTQKEAVQAKVSLGCALHELCAEDKGKVAKLLRQVCCRHLRHP